MKLVDKKLGETPLQCLQRLREENPTCAAKKLAYAGRLDPLATGQLLVLIDDECKLRDEYQNLDKIYSFELLLGITSDTGDIMGELTPTLPLPGNLNIQEILPQFLGEQEQKYPVFSSKAVAGKPLWKYAKEGRLAEIEIPAHAIKVKSLEVLNEEFVNIADLAEQAITNIQKVTGDFRQEKIILEWKNLAEKYADTKLPLLKMQAHVTSGTYIRQLCVDIGGALHSAGLAWSIHRDSILVEKRNT